MYKNCGQGENIVDFGVVSLCPTINTLEEYAVGFHKHVNVFVEDMRHKSLHRAC